MSFGSALPWFLLGTVLAVGFWLGWRFRAEALRRTQAELALRSAQSNLLRISHAVESASDAIGIGDFEGNSLYHNRAHVALLGYTVAELNALPGEGSLFADPAVGKEILEVVRAGRSWSGETELKTKEGRRIPALVRADIILDQEKKPVGIFGVFTDITERRRATNGLEAERRRLSATLQSIADGVITTDAQGRVERMNRVAEKLTGWTQAEAQRLPLSTVLNLREEVGRESGAGASPIKERGDVAGERSAILVRRDGEERVIAEKWTPLPSPEGGHAGAVLVVRDISVERRSADERERANKLESLGLLAGGIAHDFSNLLTGIMGNLSLAQSADYASGEMTKYLNDIERASWRARDLTQQLLTFAKGGEPVKKIVELDGIVRESVAFALHSAPQVTARFVLPRTLWLVSADPGQLGQVINNLALNAVQAMAKRGTLLIMAENLEPGAAQGIALSGGRAVHVSLTDTGAGISPENLAKLFDPFFTTKTTGTGLGLATVYSIVKKHGGWIDVESTLGYGTTFHIYLPAAPAGAVAERLVSLAPFPASDGPTMGAVSGKSATRVLLMDDEVEVRETVGLMLTLLGYEVVAAREGHEAIALFQKARQSGRPFTAVILDLRVPDGLGGAETIKRLRAIDPQLKALVASGYSEDPTLADYRSAGFDATIAKPFNLEDLRRVVEGLAPRRR